ncbi:MAG: transrane and repeat-containing protein 1-like [Cyanobacteria bacterium RYN_339]|nr:transrane and repeat-containing protein 1-like [Cyanobacteria bacterium RYN_339]
MDLTSLPPFHPSVYRPVIFPALLVLFCAGLMFYEWRRKRDVAPAPVWHPARPMAGPQLAALGNEPAHAALQAGRWLQALHLLAVVEPDPLDAWTPYHLALCYEHLGRWREAETFYQEALVADPHHRHALFNLARLQAATHRVTDAIGTYRRLPEDVDALFNLGHLYFQLRLYPQAAMAWKQAKLADPHAMDVRANLRLLGRLRRAGEARAA